MAISTAFQNRFKELVSELDIKNKTEIAEKIGIGYAIFDKIYNYGIYPSPKIVVRIADFFNVPLDYLTGNSDDDYFDKAKSGATFIDRLDELRLSKELSYYELGKNIGISGNYFTDWKNKHFTPSMEILESLSNYFGVSIDYLLGRTDYKN